MLKNKEDIKNWLEQYNITGYTINDDLTVDINGSVDLYGKSLTTIPIQFGYVSESFDCADNQLISLEGSLNCSNNKLASLQYCPKNLKDFDCSYNELTSLKGCPEIINGSFFCYNNKLNSLKYSPTIIHGDFACDNNEFNSLVDCPLIINGNFQCNDNPIEHLKGFSCEFTGEFRHKVNKKELFIELFEEYYKKVGSDGFKLNITSQQIQNILLNQKLNNQIPNKKSNNKKSKL